MRLVAAGLFVICLATPALGIRAPESPLLPDLDLREQRGLQAASVLALNAGVPIGELIAGPPVDPGPRRRAAVAKLQGQAGPITVSWSPVTGSPRMLFAEHGVLSPPADERPEIIARAFVREHRDLFLMSPEQVEALKLRVIIPTSAGGSVVHFRQKVDGLDVYHGTLAVSVLGDGRVLHVMGSEVSGERASGPLSRRSDPSQALIQAAAAAGVELASTPIPLAPLPDGGARFALAELRGDTDVVPVAFATFGGPRFAWKASVALAKSPASYEIVVDDATLQPLFRVTRTQFLDTRGRVFTHDPGVGTHDLVRFPDATDYRVDASLAGWCDESGSRVYSIGNNTFVQDDATGDDETTPGARAVGTTGTPQLFDFAYTDGSATDADASLTNLFWAINDAHDRFHGLGFDEAAGNFQFDNLRRGGLGSDAVLGDDRDGSGTNNANFQTPPDGLPGRMQMYIWDISGSNRSSSFDVGVVYHEFGHGVSTRLVGGPADASCLFGWQGGSMGEGWSDYWAATFLEDPVIGAWVSGDVNGIRMFHLDDNPATGKDYRDFCTYPNDFQPQICEVHDNGEIWSGFLWRIREEYIALHGPAGARMVDQLVIDGMKFTACGPSFLDARDGLLLADRLETGGQHECLIKEVAVERWMGRNAASSGGNDGQPTAGNATWPSCVTQGQLAFDRTGLEGNNAVASYSCDDSLTISLTDGNFAAAPTTILVTATSGDSETVTPVAGAGPGVALATLAIVSAAPVPGDGVLQVQDGDVITARYIDLNPGGSSTTALAEIHCTPRIAVLRHHVLNGSCDDDSVAGYPELPGFLDRDETASIEVEIANLMAVAVNGSIAVDTDRPDLVTILPSSPLPVALPARIGTSPSSTTLRIVAVGSPTIVDGDVATLRFTLTAPGFTSTAPAATLQLELHRDYELQSGLATSIDVEPETGGPVGPAFTTGVLAPTGSNQWTLVTCRAPAGSTKAYHDGRPDCQPRYSDAQADPWIATPAITLGGPDTRARRVISAQWQNDIDLGVTGVPPNIPNAVDADAVAVVLTNDPAAFDTTDPINIALTSLAFYIKVDIPGVYTQDSNTNGYVLDQRVLVPGQGGAVDLSLPTHLAWYFLPDITFVQPPFDAQGRGYFFDDIAVEYETVESVPQAVACTPTLAVYSFPRILQPAAGPACAGDAVLIDASLSEARPCAAPSQLEYRFLVSGVAVPCTLDAAGSVPRVQAPDGWGTGMTCFTFPASDVTYDVEVRCTANRTLTDTSSVSLRVLDGLVAFVGGTPAACNGSAAPVVIDASASSLTGCPGAREYRFTGPAGLLDCDGDTVADDFEPSATCAIAASLAPLDVTVELRCDVAPGCVLADTAAILAVSSTASLQVDPPSGIACPGVAVGLDASGSTMTGCTSGQVEYRFRSTAGDDTGWQAGATHGFTPAASADWTVEVRCSAAPSCTSVSAPISIVVTTGLPSGTTSGTLRVTKSLPGCAPGSDVRLAWSDADYVPTFYTLLRSDDPQIDLVTERLQDVDVESATDAGVGCDGGGTPHRGAIVYFYVHLARNACTGDPIP